MKILFAMCVFFAEFSDAEIAGQSRATPSISVNIFLKALLCVAKQKVLLGSSNVRM